MKQDMLNLQLITKISGKDMAFRNAIISTIQKEAQRTSDQLTRAAQEERWMLCYTLVHSYLLKIQPYANLTFLNQLKEHIESLRSSKNDFERRHLAKELAGKIAGITQDNAKHTNIEHNASRA
jgi:hypothetical protein